MTMHPHVHVRRATDERPPEALPTRANTVPELPSFADRNIRGEVVREFQEAARQRT